MRIPLIFYMMTKIIIAGGRHFDDYELLKIKCDSILSLLNKKQIEIVSGGADGADALGEKYAKEKGYKLRIFKADWEKHGKSAGAIRNKQMAIYSDCLIAFWDGVSKGTANMILTAEYNNLKCKVIPYK
jgi:hypothetical protein